MISICITTRNRLPSFAFVLAQIEKHTNCEYQLVVVDDASDVSYFDASYRFSERAGIPAAKNKCLELAKYDHIFLFDDDTYPIADEWYLPYINSGKEHLCYTFLSYFKRKDGFKYHTLGNGCMLYVTRKCIDTIGGFDWNYGLGKYEHVDFSRRIHNARLTESVFMDVIGSDKLLYCMDQKKEIQRSFTSREMTSLLNSGAKRFAQNRKSKEFISVIK
jgi:glycosyltransferase involved in cell wall biosynthesis